MNNVFKKQHVSPPCVSTSPQHPLFHLRTRTLEALCTKTTPYTCIAWCFCVVFGGYYALYATPIDYQQGEMVRFLYLHVPASWFALALYTLMAMCSGIGRIYRIPIYHIITQSLAVPGVLMAAISLITGSLWGKPVWGTYWVWDARLTSMLLLLCMYMGYVGLTYSRGSSLVLLHRLSIFVIVGALNIPIIKWSVDVWFTLHQPASILRLGKPAIDGAFWPALLWCGGAYFFYILTHIGIMLRGNIRRYRTLNKPTYEG